MWGGRTRQPHWRQQNRAGDYVASEGDESGVFPTGAFAEISEGPVSEEMATAFQESLDDDFDTNGATIRQLLNHRSGIPDYWSNDIEQSLTAHPRRVWTTEELLETIPHVRGPLDVAFGYSSTNYVLLGLVILSVSAFAVFDQFRRRRALAANAGGQGRDRSSIDAAEPDLEARPGQPAV